jgi:hypothetical protein
LIRYIVRGVDQQDHDGVPSSPCRQAEPPARFFKALIQMFIGTGTFLVVIVQLVRALASGQTMSQAHHQVFELMGLALALAATVELTYALYTRVPSEMLDPLMLSLSAALLLQFGAVSAFDLPQGVAAAMYVAALGGLFAIRKHLSEPHPPNEWTIRDGWQQFQQWRQRRRPATRRNKGRARAKEGKHVIARATVPTEEIPCVTPADLEETCRR